jgi:hypothetical protein
MQRDLLAAWLCLLSLAGGCSGGGGSGQSVSRATANRPPEISGSPVRSIAPGEHYDFTPMASDPEGQSLSFAIARKPRWATFSATTGRLHGTPEAGDAGVYSGIEISVSDGTTATVLPSFDLAVDQRGNGSITLSWLPPTENADGSALTDLAGYRIYYGRHARALDHTIVLDNPGLSRYVVEGLSSAKWYFAMTSVNLDGVESRRSATVNKKIR